MDVNLKKLKATEEFFIQVHFCQLIKQFLSPKLHKNGKGVFEKQSKKFICYLVINSEEVIEKRLSLNIF